jgi:hypothetical protein
MTPDALHDAGGKVRLPLPANMRGGAVFSGPKDCHRLMLWREWGREGAAYALWIGQNPSVADTKFDDPTVRREIERTQRLGLTAYRKVNVSAYRCTDPKGLRDAPIRCEQNLPVILDAAQNAVRVIVAFGTLKDPMRDLAEEIVTELRAAGVTLWCLGTTADGSPRHPLYLSKDTPLMEWPGWPA